jgi:Holliday junction resolvase RusA-like endonuclease
MVMMTSSINGNKVLLTLPIYFGTRKKYLIGMNWYGTTHYRTRNKVKQEFHGMIDKVVSKIKLKSPIKTHYKLYYKNKLSDADNIISVIDKFLMDALQESGTIINDNVQHYVQSSWEVISQDRDNPRVEVIIEEC